MGTARALVVGSPLWPPWMAAVSNWNGCSDMGPFLMGVGIDIFPEWNDALRDDGVRGKNGFDSHRSFAVDPFAADRGDAIECPRLKAGCNQGLARGPCVAQRMQANDAWQRDGWLVRRGDRRQRIVNRQNPDVTAHADVPQDGDDAADHRRRRGRSARAGTGER